jgi:3-hydroxyacyl-CoA dehydrogenase/3-hydroxy-2-methylbutyryl-CoA dehydrogenase
MKNLVTLIIGGLSGLGLACVKRFVYQLNTHVIICDLPSASRSSIPSSSLFLPTDVTSEFDVKNVFDRIQKDFGHLDVLINCAGIILSQQILGHSFEDFSRVIDVNINGTYNMIRAKVPSTPRSLPLFSARLGSSSYVTLTSCYLSHIFLFFIFLSCKMIFIKCCSINRVTL